MLGPSMAPCCRTQRATLATIILHLGDEVVLWKVLIELLLPSDGHDDEHGDADEEA